MVAAIRQHVTVQPGGVIELRSSELQAGSQAEVIVLVEQKPSGSPRKMADFIGAAKGVYADAVEVDRYIRAERDAWEP